MGVLFKPKVGAALTMTMADITKDVCLQSSDIQLENETQTLTTCQCEKCKGVDGKVDCGCPLVFSCDSSTKIGPECNCEPKQHEENTDSDTKSTWKHLLLIVQLFYQLKIQIRVLFFILNV